jgi:hypothetical protein
MDCSTGKKLQQKLKSGVCQKEKGSVFFIFGRGHAANALRRISRRIVIRGFTVSPCKGPRKPGVGRNVGRMNKSVGIFHQKGKAKE